MEEHASEPLITPANSPASEPSRTSLGTSQNTPRHKSVLRIIVLILASLITLCALILGMIWSNFTETGWQSGCIAIQIPDDNSHHSSDHSSDQTSNKTSADTSGTSPNNSASSQHSSRSANNTKHQHSSSCTDSTTRFSDAQMRDKETITYSVEQWFRDWINLHQRWTTAPNKQIAQLDNLRVNFLSTPVENFEQTDSSVENKPNRFADEAFVNVIMDFTPRFSAWEAFSSDQLLQPLFFNGTTIHVDMILELSLTAKHYSIVEAMTEARYQILTEPQTLEPPRPQHPTYFPKAGQKNTYEITRNSLLVTYDGNNWVSVPGPDGNNAVDGLAYLDDHAITAQLPVTSYVISPEFTGFLYDMSKSKMTGQAASNSNTPESSADSGSAQVNPSQGSPSNAHPSQSNERYSYDPSDPDQAALIFSLDEGKNWYYSPLGHGFLDSAYVSYAQGRILVGYDVDAALGSELMNVAISSVPSADQLAHASQLNSASPSHGSGSSGNAPLTSVSLPWKAIVPSERADDVNLATLLPQGTILIGYSGHESNPQKPAQLYTSTDGSSFTSVSVPASADSQKLGWEPFVVPRRVEIDANGNVFVAIGQGQDGDYAHNKRFYEGIYQLFDADGNHPRLDFVRSQLQPEVQLPG